MAVVDKLCLGQVSVTGSASDTYTLTVDADGDAATSNITVRSAGTDEIEGAVTEVINTDSKCLIFRVATDGKWERSA